KCRSARLRRGRIFGEWNRSFRGACELAGVRACHGWLSADLVGNLAAPVDSGSAQFAELEFWGGRLQGGSLASRFVAGGSAALTAPDSRATSRGPTPLLPRVTQSRHVQPPAEEGLTPWRSARLSTPSTSSSPIPTGRSTRR